MLRQQQIQEEIFISNDSSGCKIKNSNKCIIQERSTNSKIKFSKNCDIQNSHKSIIKFSNNCKIINSHNCSIEFSKGITLTNRNNVHISKNREDNTNEINKREYPNRRLLNSSSPPPPSPPPVSRRGKKIGITTEGETELNQVCNICKENIITRELKTILKCCHVYHKNCVDKWSQISNFCPDCKTEF